MDDNNNHIIDNDNLAGARQPILLTPEGQQLFSILKSYINSELPPYTNSKMNGMLNNMAASEGEFVPTVLVRQSVVDLFFRDDITDEQRGLTITITDKVKWPKEEKRYETALRLFPDVLLEERDGHCPIQWLALREEDDTYNLKHVSLIPIVIKLGIELDQFDELLRGGLLSPYPYPSPSEWNTLQEIICYYTKKNENNELLDDCFSIVRNWMRENKHLVIEDVREYNLVGKFFEKDDGSGIVSESRTQYLINMDPMTLALPCDPENGNCLPIHWSAGQEGIQLFCSIVKAGILYSPEKFGFVFSDGTHQDINGRVFQGTPFQSACKKYGQENLISEVINCITEYYFASSSASTSSDIETFLLMSAITDEAIHIDGLYILLRKDPEAAFLMLQQKLHLLVGDGQIVTDTNSNSNNKNTNDASSSNNNNNNATSCAFSSTSSSISTTNTIATAVSSSTNTNNNNNNNDDTHNNRDIEITAQHQPSSSLSKLKGKKRKHEMV